MTARLILESERLHTALCSAVRARTGFRASVIIDVEVSTRRRRPRDESSSGLDA
jgi:hypothetical protein